MANLTINGKSISVDVEDDTPLLWAIRENVGLTGTKYGCGIAQCGACTIMLDNVAVRSCMLPVSAVSKKSITTIEGLSENGDHPVQKAWIEQDVAQCGYCQTGQLMSAAALLASGKAINDETIAQAMSGNICRCGTYPRIRAAIHAAATKLA